jgi:hypothetical protein
MRTLLFLSFLFFVTSCSQQKTLADSNTVEEATKPTFEIEVVTRLNKYNSDKAYLDEFTLYKDNQELKTIAMGRSNSIKVSNLTAGNYKIRYRSLFNRWEYQEFVISSYSKKTIELSLDYYDYSSNKNILFIDELKVGEKLDINYKSRGCFHGFETQLEIRRDEKGFHFKFYKQEKLLTASELELLRQFEIELRCNMRRGCTTENRYTLVNPENFDFFETVDGTCTWGGISYVLEKLGFNPLDG